MPELTFAQTARRNYTVPVIVALTLISIAAGAMYRSMSGRVVVATVTQTKVYALTTVYKVGQQPGGFTVLKKNAGESDLYIAPTVRIENHLNVPLFLKDFTIKMTIADGELHTSAIEKNDLETVYTAVPAVKPLMTAPLLRESEVPPGQTVVGTVLAQFAIPQSTWDHRQSAALTIDFYHQPSMTIPIPKP